MGVIASHSRLSSAGRDRIAGCCIKTKTVAALL